MTVGLAMIVRNETLVLPRLAASLEGHLDHWTIVDTGSTDDTIEMVGHLFAGTPGEVISAEWTGFGPARDVALQAARRRTDWVLTMDADETLHGRLEMLDAVDAVEAAQHFDPVRYWMPRLLRSSSEWRWHGRTHEHLAVTGRQGVIGRTSSFHVEHHADGANRTHKYTRDIEMLTADLAELGEDARTLFYLARTYDDTGNRELAVEFYERRAKAGGWEEETWYAAWRLSCCLLAVGRTDEGLGGLWRLWGERTWRAEPLMSLAVYYQTTGQRALCRVVCRLAESCDGGDVRGDRLFVHLEDYSPKRWQVLTNWSTTDP